MPAYQTVVVGTDGSETSLRAVDQAAAIAGKSNAALIIATGHFPAPDDLRAADLLKNDGYRVCGQAPIYELLREASERAKAAGAKNIDTRAPEGSPTKVLKRVVDEVNADLLVVGNVGLDRTLGRWLSIPANVSRRANCEILIANTTGKGGDSVSQRRWSVRGTAPGPSKQASLTSIGHWPR
ncbi:universal stress protein [Mycobacterium spongiae]|uniref:Universal stress protein n=1 Tax=Mycobacterium spongiae TaxID=886343 RepID=A0A975PVQ8_9MYCO|nr:universal stress protein [Mycobacterium spongiae]